MTLLCYVLLSRDNYHYSLIARCIKIVYTAFDLKAGIFFLESRGEGGGGKNEFGTQWVININLRAIVMQE